MDQASRGAALLACWLLVLVAACSGGSSGGGGASTPAGPPLTSADAARFLGQATFGASPTDIQHLISLGDSTTAYGHWIDEQVATPVSSELTYVRAALPTPVPSGFDYTQLQDQRLDIWLQNALSGSDQLRQRIAFALSEIMVISQVTLDNYPLGMADYYDLLARDAFGNFRQLMQDVTLHPMMGLYLNVLGNQKPNAVLNIRPDENYAREALQLFTIGLVQLNPDGSVQNDAQGVPLPTYDQSVVEGFAHVYTGWNWACVADSPADCSFFSSSATLSNQNVPMQAFADQHDSGSKQVLAYSGAALTTIPAGQDPTQDLNEALDNIFNHPNVGPFIARQLIQKLIASNPSAAYVQRVAAAFNDDGTGQRGNLAAVVRAVLLDSEARNASVGSDAGKIKEPLIRVLQLWRAYGARSTSGKILPATNFLSGPAATTGEAPLQSGSVFNFFSPSYAPSGEIANAGLVAPELQIATEYQNTLLTDYLFVLSFCRMTNPLAGCPAITADEVTLDTSADQAAAGDATTLVTGIASRLLGGQISATLQNAAVTQVNLVPASAPNLRVAEALWLISSSPEFALQH